MPRVGKKHYPYTEAGVKAASRARTKARKARNARKARKPKR